MRKAGVVVRRAALQDRLLPHVSIDYMVRPCSDALFFDRIVMHQRELVIVLLYIEERECAGIVEELKNSVIKRTDRILGYLDKVLKVTRSDGDAKLPPLDGNRALVT